MKTTTTPENAVPNPQWLHGDGQYKRVVSPDYPGGEPTETITIPVYNDMAEAEAARTEASVESTLDEGLAMLKALAERLVTDNESLRSEVANLHTANKHLRDQRDASSSEVYTLTREVEGLRKRFTHAAKRNTALEEKARVCAATHPDVVDGQAVTCRYCRGIHEASLERQVRLLQGKIQSLESMLERRDKWIESAADTVTSVDKAMRSKA